jgi:hypothetical protein
MAKGEALEIFGAVVGTPYGVLRGLYGMGKGVVTGDLGTIGDGFKSLGSAAMPRAGSHSGLGWPGTPKNVGITPGTGTKLNNASIWHDNFTSANGFGSRAQSGWIQRAWTGPGVELGIYGQAYRVLGTVGFGLAGGAQAVMGY